MENTKRAWVFAGGDFSRSHLALHEVKDDDLIVCVDRGLVYCLEAGLRPDMLVGDLDSAPRSLLQDERIAHVKRYVFPSKKAASDLELALKIVSDEPVDEVILLGISGGRTDHMLFNWQLVRLGEWPFKLQYIDETNHTYVLKGDSEVIVDAAVDSFLSLLAMEHCAGVSTKGLRYPLNKADIEVGSTLGLSNVIESTSVRVEISSGTLLVMLERVKEGVQ